MTADEKIECKLILDDPVESDSFSGGGHARSALALAHVIRQFDDQDRAIGLEGKWGSGKSSIIKIAERELKPQEQESGKRFHVFTFDLWGAQPDHFRRVFLESLLSWMERKFDAKTRFVKKKRNQVRDRVITVTTNNHKIIGFYGLLVFLFLLLLPAMYTWLSPFALLNPLSENSLPIWTIVSVAVMGTMAIVAAFAAIYRYCSTGRRKRSWGKAFAGTLSPFSQESETTHITQNIREEDPTQYEFDTHFREIVEQIQAGDDRIIIVFDNIDRLPSEVIPGVWSEIRSIFARDSTHVYESSRSITVIVPYDREHILQAYETRTIKNADKEVESPPLEAKVRPRHAFLRKDIFRKSFDAIFHVSPPILSDASNFFRKKFSEALHNHFQEDSARRVYRIFDMQMQDVDEPPTPRQLISFVNSVAAIWEQRQGDIPLEAIAVYVVKQDVIEMNPTNLRIPGFIDHRYVDQTNLSESRLKRFLAALAYNVDAKHGYQVLLDGEIERLFTLGERKGIKEISKSPGFEETLHVVFEEKADRWARDSVQSFANAAQELAELDRPPDVKRRSEKAMLDRISQLEPVRLSALSDYNSVLAVLDFCKDVEIEDTFRALESWVGRCVPKEEESRNFQSGRDWTLFIGAIVAKLEKRSEQAFVDRLVKTIRLPAGIEFLMGAAYSVDEADVELHLRDMICEVAEEDLVARLRTLIVEKPNQFHYIWPEVKDWISDDKTDSLMTVLSEDLRSDAQDDDIEALGDKLEAFIQVYADADHSNGRRDKLCEELVNDGALYKHGHDMEQSEADTEDVTAVHAAILFLIVSVHKDAQLPDTNFQNHPLGDLRGAYQWFRARMNEGWDDEVIELTADQVVKCKQLSKYIAAAAKEASGQNLLKRIVVSAIGKDAVTPATQAVVGNYEFLRDLIDTDDLEKLLIRVGKLPENDWEAVDLSAVSLSLAGDIKGRKEKGWKKLLQRINKWLKDTTEEEWSASLEADDRRLKMLRRRVSDSNLVVPATNLTRPLREHFVGTLVGEIEPDGDFDKVVRALPHSTRSSIKREMLEHLDSKIVTEDGVLHGLACYSNTLEELPITKTPDISVTRLLKPLIAASTDKARDFIAQRKKDWRAVRQKASDSEVGTIQELLEELHEKPDEETKQRAQAIASAIGLSI